MTFLFNTQTLRVLPRKIGSVSVRGLKNNGPSYNTYRLACPSLVPQLIESGYVHGVSFRTVFFENVPESKLLDNLTTEYDFFMAKSWNF